LATNQITCEKYVCLTQDHDFYILTTPFLLFWML